MKNLEIVCSQCSKVLAVYDALKGVHDPSPEFLNAHGAVAVPNFGWFCSQGCASEFERAKPGKLFNRNAAGEVQYYEKP